MAADASKVARRATDGRRGAGAEVVSLAIGHFRLMRRFRTRIDADGTAAAKLEKLGLQRPVWRIKQS
jgi:hypothetical protein